jgi:hypothetical protein
MRTGKTFTGFNDKFRSDHPSGLWVVTNFDKGLLDVYRKRIAYFDSIKGDLPATLSISEQAYGPCRGADRLLTHLSALLVNRNALTEEQFVTFYQHYDSAKEMHPAHY